MRQVRSRGATWLFAACTIALAACGGDSNGPGEGSLSDPAGLNADMDALSSPFSAPVLQSFDVVALSSSGTPTAKLVSFVAALSPHGKIPSAGGAMQAKQGATFRALKPALAVRPSFAVLPAEVLGNVYEWDTSLQEYVEGVATGPANGVRFILYALNPLTGQFNEPLDPVGYADFLDESSGSTNRLHIEVVGDDAVTYANYVVSGAVGSTAAASAEGFITNGVRRLDFAADLSASATEIGLHYELTLDQPAVSAELTIAVSFSSETNAVIENSFRITRGSESVLLDGVMTLQSNGQTFTATANFTVNVNGGLFASISGSSASGTAVSYTITGPGGRALTAAEREAVERLFDAPFEMDTLITILFEPLAQIFGAYSPTA